MMWIPQTRGYSITFAAGSQRQSRNPAGMGRDIVANQEGGPPFFNTRRPRQDAVYYTASGVGSAASRLVGGRIRHPRLPTLFPFHSQQSLHGRV